MTLKYESITVTVIVDFSNINKSLNGDDYASQPVLAVRMCLC